MSLSVQWGTYETANASAKLITITFPVSFAVTAYSVALGHKGLSNWTNGANVDYVNKTVSDMTVYYCDGYGFSWLAIGMQQWGLYDFSGSNGDKVYFPVAFTVMCAAAIVQPAGRNSHEVTNRTTTYIQGDFRFGDSQKVGTWIAVGY